MTCHMNCRVPRAVLILIALLTAVFSSACSSLNTRNDYWPARDELRRNYPENALAKLPKNERGTFINLMEKTYLSLLTGNPDIDQLLKYSKKIDNQVRYKISKEIKSLFYVETPEGYYASEHEIIWMHMLLSWGFSLRHDYENACVEAKIASFLLSSKWSPEGTFDDPFIRIVLGSLWAMAGDWENARVDFRAAHKLDNKLKWANTLADLDTKPERLIIILGGTGPEPQWIPDDQRNGIRGYRNVSFEMSGIKSDLQIEKQNGATTSMNTTHDAMKWYLRHYDRNNSISEVIGDTKYAQKAIAGGLEGAAIISIGIVIGAAVCAGGIGAGIFFLTLEAETSGEAAFTAFFLGFAGGGSIIYSSYGLASHNMKNHLDESDTYRFVRFLPEYAWLDWTDKISEQKLRLIRKTDHQVRRINSEGKVTDGYYARSDEVQEIRIDTSDRLINGVYMGFFPDAN